MNLQAKLTHVVGVAIKEAKPLTYKVTNTVIAASTSAAPDQRLTPQDAAALKKIAAQPDSMFRDKQLPTYVKAQRDEIRDYAESIKALQRVRFEMQSKVPGIEVGLKKDIAVVDMNELGYHHELILEVSMPGKKAEADGTLEFQYGGFQVQVDVKKGQTRESILARIGSRLDRQQEGVRAGHSSETSREFLLHRFKPPSPEERKARDLNAAHESIVWGSAE